MRPDPNGEDERQRLHDLHEKISVVADSLADLVARVRTAEADASVQLPTPGDSEALAQAAGIRRMIKGRQLRNQLVQSDLFADPAWDMLLELYASRLEEAEVSVTVLCLASGVPASTALRRISALETAGLIARQRDDHDKRRCAVLLTDGAMMLMWEYFRTIRRRGLILN